MAVKAWSKVKRFCLAYRQRVFRYPLGTVYMLAGYLLSFVVLFQGVSVFLSGQDAEAALQSRRKSSRTYIDYPEEVPYAVFMEALQTLDCRAVLKEMALFSDAENMARLVDVVVHDPAGASGCVIGDSLEGILEQQAGGAYIRLAGDLYPVTELIDGKGGSLSYIVEVPYEILSVAARRQVEMHIVLASVLLESDSVDTAASREMLENTLSEMTGEAILVKGYTNADAVNTSGDTKLVIYLCIFAYLFCMVNCIIVCEFWIFQRRREIAVRRAYHFSDGRIVELLFKDMMLIVGTACLLYLMLQPVLFAPVMRRLSLRPVYDFRSIAFLLLMIPISALITIFPYMRRLSKRSLAAGLKE